MAGKPEQVDPFMQTRPLQGVPPALQSGKKPPNSMARPINAPGQLPARGQDEDPLLDEDSADTDEQDESIATDLEGHETSPLPGHMPHYCTNVIWIFITPLVFACLYFPIQKASAEGDLSKFFRGFDYLGRMCGRDQCELGPCGRFTYFCARAPGEFPDTAHPICVESCPTSNATAHMCFDSETQTTVEMPDVPTVEFNMKCLQLAHAEKVAEGEESRVFRGLSRFKGAGSFEGFLMDSVHSLRRAKWLLVENFFLALVTSLFYMIFLRFMSSLLIRMSVMLIVIVPACYGIWHVILVFTKGGMKEVMGGNTQAQLSFLNGVGGLCVASVLCCTMKKLWAGITMAEGCIIATADCMFAVKSIMLEPLVSLFLKTFAAGPLIYLALVYVSTGRMILYMSESEMHRNLSLNAEHYGVLFYVGLMILWVLDISHNATQYVLAYVTERWYFTMENDEGQREDLEPCLTFRAVFNMLRYHFGSILLGAFLKSVFRVPKILFFILELLGCCDRRKKSKGQEDGDEKGVHLSCKLMMKLLRKEGFMDMAITSAEYCTATQHALETLEGSSTEVVLNWVQLIFQVGGWAGTTSMCTIFATVMVSMPQYSDPGGDDYLDEPDAVIIACAALGLMCSISFMNVFDVVGDTILYCLSLEEQRYRQQTAAKYDPYGEDTSFLQRCTCRSKNGDGFFGWLLGYEEDVEHQGHPHGPQYAPKSLLDALAPQDS